MSDKKQQLLSLIFIVVLTTLSSNYSLQAADITRPHPKVTFVLQGKIGKDLAVHMVLEKRDVVRTEGKTTFTVGEQYSGYYYYDKYRKHITLRGYFNAQGMGGATDDPEVEIAEFINGKKTGVFIGRFDASGNFSGDWESFDPQRQLPFNLRVTKRLKPER
jgi:hypothetical protein